FCGSLFLTSGTALGPLRAVLGTTLVAAIDARCVERTANDMVTDARQVLHTTAAYEHDAVFLEVVSFTGYVGRDFDLVGEADTRHFAQGRVGLLGRRGVDAGADATLEWVALERGCF